MTVPTRRRTPRVDVVRPVDLGPGDVARWAALQREHPGLDNPFMGPSFALAVDRVRPGTRVAVLGDAAGPGGFLPFERRRGGRAVALGAGLSDAQGLVAAADLDVDLAVVLRAAGLRSLRADHLVGPVAPALGTAVARLTAQQSPALDLRGGFEAYARRQRERSRSLLQSTARKRRKLERDHGPVHLVTHEADHAVLDRALGWKSAQYRRTGRQDRFADPRTLRLVHDLLDVDEPDLVARLAVLRAGDQVVAAHLGLRSPGTLAWWFPVYDPEFAPYSPGLVLCLAVARAAAGEGVTTFDLGKGDEPYKDRLADRRIPLLEGVVATDRLALGLRTAWSLPRDQALRVVLGSPRLRAAARGSLAAVGRARSGDLPLRRADRPAGTVV